MTPGRVSVVRAAWGCLLLLAPAWVARRLLWSGGERSSGRAMIRVLGTRQLVQAAATARRPSGRLLSLGAGVDVLHAMTAAAFAASGPDRRVAGGVATVLATGFAAAGWRTRDRLA